MKIIIGAGNTKLEGWTSTQKEELDLLCREDFERMFQKEKPSAFLAEHVWEHMTFDEGIIAAKNCYDFWKMAAICVWRFLIKISETNGIKIWSGSVETVTQAIRHIPTRSFTIIIHSRRFLNVRDFQWNFLNIVTKMAFFIISTGMKLMEGSDVPCDLTHEIQKESLG